MDKTLNIKTEGIQTDHKDTFHNHRYEPTSYSILERIFEEFPLTKQDVLVDYGCGKGRLNFYVNHRFSCASVGVEYNEVYINDALHNWNSYSGRKKDLIQFFCCKAEDYIVQDQDTVFYFFHPFSQEIFAKVMNQILKSYEKTQRKMYLLLYYPDKDYQYYIEEMTPFMEYRTIELYGESKNPREKAIIYELG